MAQRKYVKIESKICRDYLGGISLDSISARYDIPKPSIYGILTRNGIKPNRGAPRLFTKDKEIVIGALYSGGLSMEVLAERFECGISTICLTIQRLGIQARTNRKYHVGYLDFFDIIDAEDKAYWAGFIAADGCITNDRKSMVLALQHRDGSHIERFLEAIYSDYLVRTTKKNCSVQIYGERFIQGLFRLPGMGPRKTFTIRWPERAIDYQLLRHYLRGYTDGDGGFYVYERNDRSSLYHSYAVTSNFFFLSGLQLHLARACDLGKVKLRKRKDKLDRSRSLKYSGRLQVKRIFDYLYKDATIWLPRKRDKIEPYL